MKITGIHNLGDIVVPIKKPPEGGEPESKDAGKKEAEAPQVGAGKTGNDYAREFDERDKELMKQQLSEQNKIIADLMKGKQQPVAPTKIPKVEDLGKFDEAMPDPMDDQYTEGYDDEGRKKLDKDISAWALRKVQHEMKQQRLLDEAKAEVDANAAAAADAGEEKQPESAQDLLKERKSEISARLSSLVDRGLTQFGDTMIPADYENKVRNLSIDVRVWEWLVTGFDGDERNLAEGLYAMSMNEKYLNQVKDSINISQTISNLKDIIVKARRSTLPKPKEKPIGRQTMTPPQPVPAPEIALEEGRNLIAEFSLADIFDQR